MTTTKRLADAYHDGDITLAQRNAYINAGRSLNDLITIGVAAGAAVGDFDMTSDKILNLATATEETDAANLGNIKQRVGSAVITHDGGGTQVICTVPAKARVDRVTIVVTETFNGSLDIGDVANGDRLFADSDIVKTVGQTFQVLAKPVYYAAQTVITANLHGNTTGVATVYIDFVQLGNGVVSGN